jgi:hypothetical protein
MVYARAEQDFVYSVFKKLETVLPIQEHSIDIRCLDEKISTLKPDALRVQKPSFLSLNNPYTIIESYKKARPIFIKIGNSCKNLPILNYAKIYFPERVWEENSYRVFDGIISSLPHSGRGLSVFPYAISDIIAQLTQPENTTALMTDLDKIVHRIETIEIPDLELRIGIKCGDDYGTISSKVSAYTKSFKSEK